MITDSMLSLTQKYFTNTKNMMPFFLGNAHQQIFELFDIHSIRYHTFNSEKVVTSNGGISIPTTPIPNRLKCIFELTLVNLWLNLSLAVILESTLFFVHSNYFFVEIHFDRSFSIQKLILNLASFYISAESQKR